MASNSIANGFAHASGELPNSTLAAQLVDSLTRGKQHPNHQDRADFESLLQILEADKKGEQLVDIIEEVEESAKLVDVVVKAGIDPLFRESPFEGQDSLAKQASRSLGAIEITIRRCPEVLLFQRPGHQAGPMPCGPLYLWLVPKLLVVASNEQQQQLRSNVAAVLQTSMAVDHRLRSKGAGPRRVFRYIQGCIKGKPP